MNIHLRPIPVEERDVLVQWMSLFLHDLSPYASDMEIEEDGRFHFDVLDLFFEKEGLTPYWIGYENRKVGFMLIQSGPYTNPEHADYVINSFFILKKYRRLGIGRAAVLALFDRFPGRYCCGQLEANEPAVRFWQAVYAGLGLQVFELKRVQDGDPLTEQYFRVDAPGSRRGAAEQLIQALEG